MARAVTVRVIQNPAAERIIKQLSREFLRENAEAVADDARRFTPVDTGRLRESIHTSSEGGDSVNVQADAEYAAYVELGTRNMAAQPYLRPALYRKRTT